MRGRSQLWKLILIAELLVPLAVIAIGVGGTLTALHLEESDAFCAACHTQPELAYYQQSQVSPGATLAAYHAHTQKQSVRCIDCHSGAGPLGRAVGLSQGAHDLLAYVSGRYHSPAITTTRSSDEACLKCHADVEPAAPVGRVASLRNHFHEFLPLWHQVDAAAAGCVDCHAAHPEGDPRQRYLNNGAVSQVCDRCHRALSGRADD